MPFGHLPFLTACAIHARDYKAVVEHGRKIIFTYQFNNEPIRVLLASLASGHRQLDAFVASAFQKAMLREVRFSDLACNHPEQIKWNPSKRRFFSVSASSKSEYDDEGEGEDDTGADPSQMQVDAPSLPKKPNPLLVTMYGQSCTSYQSAICTFRRRSLRSDSADAVNRLLTAGLRELSRRSSDLHVSGNCFAGSCDAEAGRQSTPHDCTGGVRPKLVEGRFRTLPRVWRSCRNIESSVLRTRIMLKRLSTILAGYSTRSVSFFSPPEGDRLTHRRFILACRTTLREGVRNR